MSSPPRDPMPSSPPAEAATRRASRLFLLPLPLVLALRFLKSTRRDAFTTFLSAVAIGGIGLGVAALIVALALLSGLQEALRDETLERTPHLEVELALGAPAGEVRDLAAAVPGVVRAQLLVRSRGWALLGGGTEAVELVGYEGELPESFPGAATRRPGLYVSEGLARRWGVEAGDTVRVVSPRPTLTPLGPQPRLRALPLTGTFASSRTQEGERIALRLADARPLLEGGPVVLQLTTTDLAAALDIAPRLREQLPEGSVVRTWSDLNRPLFFALRLEKLAMFVGVALIVLVAALALVADLALVISSKRAEIGMLGAMGATPATLRTAFLALGLILAGLGIGAGAAVGCSAALTLDHFQLLPLPPRVYFLDTMPFRLQATDLAGVIALSAVLSLLATLYVAQRVVAIDPREALRR